jgi:hypothetical protein
MLKRKEMKALLTDDLWIAMRIWKDYKRFGLPNGKGPLEESHETLMLINGFEDEFEDAIASAKEERG